MKLFYECNFFDEKWNRANDFTVAQKELRLKSVLSKDKLKFEKIDVSYLCSWNKSGDFNPDLPCVLIPIKDNVDLLKVTIDNLVSNNVSIESNVIIIDDRSLERLDKYLPDNFSYLRVDNNKGFNFSMLNNIAAKICYDLGCSEMALWNSDLWTPNSETFKNILKKHRQENSIVSSTKLVYPPQEMSLNGEVDTINIKQFGSKFHEGKWRNTVQFGGDVWVKSDYPISHSPSHFKRFASPEDPFVNCNKPCFFVTGAFHLWDLQKFIEIGGLNPSLAKNFQDVDICLRVVKQHHAPLYFGKDVFLYHDESANFHSLNGEKKNDSQMKSDCFLFGKIWQDLDEVLYR